MNDCTKQVLLITGASSGMEKALACALAPQAPKLVLVARNRARLQEVGLACGKLGASAGTGVTVTIVVPDFVHTEIFERSIWADGQPFGRVLQGHSRFLTAEKYADMIMKAMS